MSTLKTHNPRPGNDAICYAGVCVHGGTRADLTRLSRACRLASRPGRVERTIRAELKRAFPWGSDAGTMLETINGPDAGDNGGTEG